MEHRTIENGVTGERVVFGAYETDEDGEYLRLVSVSLPVGVDGPPAHRHPHGDERFEVVAGELGIEVEGVRYVLEPGESLTVPAGAAHRWWNEGDTTVVGRGELRAPGRFEELLTTVFALANSGQTDDRGRPGLLQAAVTFAAYRHEYDLAFLPTPAKWLAYGVLAPIGRLLGYRAVHHYVDPPRVVPVTVEDAPDPVVGARTAR